MEARGLVFRIIQLTKPIRHFTAGDKPVSYTHLDVYKRQDHACDQVCACTTCHVIVREGYKTLNEPEEKEEDLLDKAWGLEPNSRLSCQAIVEKTDLVIEIPKYSINMAKEGHR